LNDVDAGPRPHDQQLGQQAEPTLCAQHWRRPIQQLDRLTDVPNYICGECQELRASGISSIKACGVPNFR
jgi:hypothetical protein